MARKKSSSKNDPTPQSDTVAPDAGSLGGDTVLIGDETLGEDAVAVGTAEDVTLSPADGVTERLDEAPTPEDTPDTEPAPPQSPAAPTQSGPGAGTLVVAGVVAAALGYGAAYFGLRPDAPAPNTDQIAALEQQNADLQQTLTALSQRVEDLATMEPPELPEVDFAPLEAAIAQTNGDLSDALAGLEDRLQAVEARPVFSGEADADSAAMAAAIDALEARLAEERSAAAQAQAAAQEAQAAAAAQIGEAAAAAQTAIAEAEARAQATADTTRTQAALAQIRIAMAAGDPFDEALGALELEPSEALQAAAQTGVPTTEALQARFPSLAREALATAITETAPEGVVGGLGAFLQSQLGGRSVAPRDGDDPDAVLSRAEAALRSGDLSAALSEIAALPEGAQAVLGDWTRDAQMRLDTEAELATLATGPDQ